MIELTVKVFIFMSSSSESLRLTIGDFHIIFKLAASVGQKM